MTEVLIQENKFEKSAWYHERFETKIYPNIKSKILEITPMRTKKNSVDKSLWSKIIPVVSLKKHKAIVYSQIAGTNGAIFTSVRIL